MKKRILVTGSHRSGTTWVGKILSANREVGYVHEPFNIQLANSLYGLPLQKWFTYIPDLHDEEEFQKKFEKICSFDFCQDYASYSWHFWLRRMPTNEIHRLFQKHFTSVVVVKDPIALLSAERLADRHDMNVVCMIRHPLAFCGSLKKWNWTFPFSHLSSQPSLMLDHLPKWRAEIERAAIGYVKVVDQAILLWNVLHDVIRKYQADHPDWLFLRHEDVAQDPLGSFRDVYQNLDLRFSAAVRRAIRKSAASVEGETSTPTYAARDNANVTRTWVHRLSQQEIEQVRRETSELCKHFYPDYPG